MGGIGQVLATGGTTIAGVALGAGLTYLFGALTRRHQEEREDKTRWYEMRLRAYAEFMEASGELAAIFFGKAWSKEQLDQVNARFSLSHGRITLVASQDVERLASEAFRLLLDAVRSNNLDEENRTKLTNTMTEFRRLARKDLGG